jgi:hypothetical protein
MTIWYVIQVIILIVWIIAIIADAVLNVQVKEMYRKYNTLLTEQNELLKLFTRDILPVAFKGGVSYESDCERKAPGKPEQEESASVDVRESAK